MGPSAHRFSPFPGNFLRISPSGPLWTLRPCVCNSGALANVYEFMDLTITCLHTFKRSYFRILLRSFHVPFQNLRIPHSFHFSILQSTIPMKSYRGKMIKPSRTVSTDDRCKRTRHYAKLNYRRSRKTKIDPWMSYRLRCHGFTTRSDTAGHEHAEVWILTRNWSEEPLFRGAL